MATSISQPCDSMMDLVLDGLLTGFPSSSMVKNPPANAGDVGLISGSGRSPAEGNGHPLQYSCLENPMEEEVVGYSFGHL